MDLNCRTYNHVAVVSNKCKPSSFIGEHLVEFIRSLSNWQNWKQLLVQFSEIISWWSQIILQSFIPKFRCLLRFNLLKSNSSHFQASANCERVKNIWKSIQCVCPTRALLRNWGRLSSTIYLASIYYYAVSSY